MKDFPLIFSAPMVRANHAGRKCMTRRVVDMDRLKVVMRKDVRPDYPLNLLPDKRHIFAPIGTKLKGVIHAGGAVSCRTPSGELLGVKPEEFDLVCPYAQGETMLTTAGGRNTWTIIPHESRVWVRERWAFHEVLYDDFPGIKVKFYSNGEISGWIPVRHDTFNKYCSIRYEKSFTQWRPSIHMPRLVCRDTYPVTKVRLERLQDISEADAIAEGVEPVDRDPEGDILYRDYFEGGYAWSATESFISLWHALHGFKGPNAWNCNPWVWVVEYDNPLWKLGRA